MNRKPAISGPSPGACRKAGAKWAMTLSHGLAPGCGADEAWAVIGSFGALNQWLPNVEVCDIIEGQDGVPGCVRYVAGGGRSPDGSPKRWVLEKLLDLSPDQRSFSYSILDSSYGFENYTACFTVCAHPITTTTTASTTSAAGSTSSSTSSSSTTTAAASTTTTTSSHCVLHGTSNVVTWSFEMSPILGGSRHEVFDLLTGIFNRMMGSLESTLLGPSGLGLGSGGKI